MNRQMCWCVDKALMGNIDSEGQMVEQISPEYMLSYASHCERPLKASLKFEVQGCRVLAESPNSHIICGGQTKQWVVAAIGRRGQDDAHTCTSVKEEVSVGRASDEEQLWLHWALGTVEAISSPR